MSDESSLGHVPSGERWAFDASVAGVFDDMLARSIPDYARMRSLVAAVAARNVYGPGAMVVDLGCSRGGAIAELLDRESPPALRFAEFVGFECSPPMLELARARFEGRRNVTIRAHDLRRDPYPVPIGRAVVTLSVLTLQFTPIEHRQRIVRDVWRSTREGGVFILVEKVLGSSADVDALLVDLHHAEKRAAGYSQDEIDRKRLSLEGVLVPVTARWNEDLLVGAGFSQVECFWRSLNFAAWVAVR